MDTACMMAGAWLSACDAQAWFGIKFEGLDCPHWLPYMDAATLDQLSPKLTIGGNQDLLPEAEVVSWEEGIIA